MSVQLDSAEMEAEIEEYWKKMGETAEKQHEATDDLVEEKMGEQEGADGMG